MRVQLKERKVNNLPRRAFLKSLVGLIAAPAVVKAENLMPIVVWRPPVVRREGWVLYNGATLKADKFPDLFNYFGGWKGETTARLPDETLGFWISEFRSPPVSGTLDAFSTVRGPVMPSSGTTWLRKPARCRPRRKRRMSGRDGPSIINGGSFDTARFNPRHNTLSYTTSGGNEFSSYLWLCAWPQPR
jgi:hypothetical protein